MNEIAHIQEQAHTIPVLVEALHLNQVRTDTEQEVQLAQEQEAQLDQSLPARDSELQQVQLAEESVQVQVEQSLPAARGYIHQAQI